MFKNVSLIKDFFYIIVYLCNSEAICNKPFVPYGADLPYAAGGRGLAQT